MKTRTKIKGSFKDKVFDVFNFIILTLVMLAVLYPLYFIVIASISDPVAVQSGEVFLLPKGFTLDGYKEVIKNQQIWSGYANSLFLVVVGTIVNLFFTIPAGFVLSHKNLPGKGLIMGFLVFTMFFNGGLIPTYLLVRDFGLINTPWALVLTDAISIMNVIIVRTYFQTSIPEELYEAAQIDGCSIFRTFFKVALPLAKPIIAIMALYYGIGHWNQFFKGIIYLQDETLYPLQLILRNILIQNTANVGIAMDSEAFLAQHKMGELIKYATIIVGSLPPLIAYPFIQKHFKKGVMIGSVKG